MKLLRTLLIGMLIAAGVEKGVAAEASVSLDVASAYVFRGGTLNEGFVAQPGIEVNGLPVTLGVWANFDFDDYNNTLTKREFSEIDLYASYDLPLETDPVGVSVGYTEYTYPSGGGKADREVAVNLGLATLLSPSLSVNYGVGGAVDDSWYVEAGVEHSQAILSGLLAVGGGATLGYTNPDVGKDGLSHYTVGVSVDCSVISAGVTYIGQIDDKVLPDVDKGGTYDADVVFTVGVAHDF